MAPAGEGDFTSPLLKWLEARLAEQRVAYEAFFAEPAPTEGAREFRLGLWEAVCAFDIDSDQPERPA